MIIIQRMGITKNSSRLANVYNEVKYAPHPSRLNYNLFTPVPIDITYKVSIVSKRQGDIDKALSNFIPFFNKDAFVRFAHPKFEGLFLKCQVIMEDSISEDHPEELDSSADDVVTAECTFLFKTWIFCGNDTASEDGNYVRHVVSVDTNTGLSTVLDTEYNGFLPTIRQVNLGFYPIPLNASIAERIKMVDIQQAKGLDVSDQVDQFIWKIDETGTLTGQAGNSYYYPPFSSDYLSGYYDKRRLSGDVFIDGQLSTYNYLSGPDAEHQLGFELSGPFVEYTV